MAAARISDVVTRSVVVGRCPLCEEELLADITVGVSAGVARAEGGGVALPIKTSLRGLELHHACQTVEP